MPLDPCACAHSRACSARTVPLTSSPSADSGQARPLLLQALRLGAVTPGRRRSPDRRPQQRALQHPPTGRGPATQEPEGHWGEARTEAPYRDAVRAAPPSTYAPPSALLPRAPQQALPAARVPAAEPAVSGAGTGHSLAPRQGRGHAETQTPSQCTAWASAGKMGQNRRWGRSPCEQPPPSCPRRGSGLVPMKL